MAGNYLAPSDKKQCPHCVRYGRGAELQVVANFRPAPGFADGLYYICRLCEKQLYDDFRLAQRAHIREKGVNHAIAQVRQATPATLLNLVDGWMGMFGGVEGFLRESMAHYEALATARPGSPAVMQYLNNLARMVAMAQKYRPADRPESELSDEAINVEIRQVAAELGFIEADPPPTREIDLNAAPGQPGE